MLARAATGRKSQHRCGPARPPARPHALTLIAWPPRAASAGCGPTRSRAPRADRSGSRAARRARAAAAPSARARPAAAGRGRPGRDRASPEARAATAARDPARSTAQGPPASGLLRAAGPRGSRLGLALQVLDLASLRIGALVRLGELFLRLALALLLAPLTAQRRVVGEVARRLLEAAADLVEDAHASRA